MTYYMGQPTMRLAGVGFLVVVSLVPDKVGLAQVPAQKAWDILEHGHNSRNTKERSNAVKALGGLPGDAHAAELAEEAIADKDADVRAAAALTLGRIGSVQSIPLLKEALKDKDIKVAFAAQADCFGAEIRADMPFIAKCSWVSAKAGKGRLKMKKSC